VLFPEFRPAGNGTVRHPNYQILTTSYSVPAADTDTIKNSDAPHQGYQLTALPAIGYSRGAPG
jgi:hypothetical protein